MKYQVYTETAELRELCEKSIRETLEAGWLAPGKKATAVENLLAEHFHMKNGCLVNSAKSALLLSLAAYGVTHGDYVKTDDFEGVIKFLGAVTTQNGSEKPKAQIVEGKKSNNIEKIAPILIRHQENYLMDPLDAVDVEIFTLTNCCCVVIFKSKEIYNAVLRMRDWGRAGTQDEDFAGRYSQFVLGDTHYDWKFVFNELGFNFKSCEMAASVCLESVKSILASEEISL